MIREATDLIASLEDDLEQAQKEYEKAERARKEADEKIQRLIKQMEDERPKPTPTPTPTEKPEPTEKPDPKPSPEPTDPPDPVETGPVNSPSPEPTEEPVVTEHPEETEKPEESEKPKESPPPPEPTEKPEETPDPTIGTGSLMWPVPSGHTVTSRVGMRISPITGEESFHGGIDIDGYGNDGGPIVACDNGVVKLAEWYGNYGNTVIIDHGNGMQTLYAHMSGCAVSVGDVVSKGQTIGYLGSTGWATGTHCHLEVFVEGGRVDPANYFSGITYYDC